MSNKYTNEIKNIRESLGWSQSELARRAGVTSAAISKIESGTSPSYEVLIKLSKALGVSVSALTGEESVKMTEKENFFVKFGDIRKLKKSDQDFVLLITKRLLKN